MKSATSKLPRRTRIAFYSPGIVGLGHLRRNLLLAQTLAESELNSVNLLVTEAREASAFVNCMPPGMDCLTLPGLSRGLDGVCRPRYLDLSLKEVIRLRSRTIRAALKEFEPDLFLVDHLPRGAYRELDPALKQLKATGRTRLVLGLRDVLGEPWAVHRDWFRWRFDDALDEYYDSVWVYGDPTLYNLVEQYRFPSSIAAKVQFLGYLDQRKRLGFAQTQKLILDHSRALPDGPFVLCLLGGGQDGERLAEAFSMAEFPPGQTGILVTGPFMPLETERRLLQRAAQNPQLRILNFVTEPTALVEKAERIIAMGGYNTICEVLSFQKRALIVPRSKPRQEQIIRAECLHRLGFIDSLDVEQLTPQALTAWMARVLPPLRVDGRLDLGGLERLPTIAASVLGKTLAQPKAQPMAAGLGAPLTVSTS